jgi:cytidylate kinase
MAIPKIIAIDGPAASGKSTLGELLAKRLGYLYFDTGVMYRAVTWIALRVLKSVDEEPRVTELAEQVQIDVRPPSIEDGRKSDVMLDGEDITWQIRRHEVDINVSQVSAYRGVRRAMTEQQRRIGERGQLVMIGRDIGTVVCPKAGLKIYLDASVEVRARRRFTEISNRGGNTPYEEILSSMKRRDKIDASRDIAPMKPAEDAVIVNTDNLSIEDVFNQIIAMLN